MGFASCDPGDGPREESAKPYGRGENGDPSVVTMIVDREERHCEAQSWGRGGEERKTTISRFSVRALQENRVLKRPVKDATGSPSFFGRIAYPLRGREHNNL